MGLKYGTGYRFVSKLVKVLKLLKTLSKIEMVLHAIVKFVRVELN